MKLIGLILTACILLTIFVGRYFVRYALVPNNGAELRNIQTAGPNILEEELDKANNQVEENMRIEFEARDKWLSKMPLEKHTVHIQSHDGLKLTGHVFQQIENTFNWFILAHGYQSNEYETLTIARHLYEQGYNVLTISLRAHGDSEGDYIGMGYLDKEDLLSWTDYVIQKNSNNQIFYHGTSMGGATVLMASGMELPSNVKAIISDCAYTSIWATFTSEIKKRFNLPSFPILHMAQIMGVLMAGYNIKDGNVIASVSKSEVPILFIHTKPDDFIPLSMAYELYDAKIKGEKELFIVSTGGHSFAKFVDVKAYYDRIFHFTEKHISNNKL